MIESMMFNLRLDPSLLPCLLLIISVAVSIFSGFLLWKVDQNTLECQTSWRAISSTALVVFTLWVTLLMHLSLFFKVSGAYGPVQFWAGDHNADFMSGPRVLAMLSIYGGFGLSILTVVLTLISLFVRPLDRRWYRIVIPIISLLLFGITLFWIDRYMFYPSA